MKKFLAFLFFTFFIVKSFAQLDTEHWFAPMMDRVKNGNYQQSLYFSTNSTTAFPVTIYNNNIAIGTVTISKGNPKSFSFDRKYIITINQSDLFTPNTLGLYCKGDKPFFANFRFSELNHAEILTSKGKAGIGTKFYAAMAPISYNAGNSILNFMTGVMATEDNTSVTVSGYKNNLQFSSPQGATITFNLNKGQSYIIDGRGTTSLNNDGFIGAKIVSDKPVSVTNGNFNGQYSGNVGNSDILMDQSVPVERLGQEFALVKGNGTIGIGLNMEGGIVIATEDNTEIYLNNGTTPVATLNEGQYYKITEGSYKQQPNDIYNMYVKATKNVYLYQLLAGADSNATGGFNYIPPLSCYLPKIIDEIGLINENLTYSGSFPGGQLYITTKLNIITEAGATVNVNGAVPNAAFGPYPLSGNNVWVTYSIPDVKGNITVTSTKAVTAGIAAGDGAIGYGGYFAGFSSIPAVVRQSGTCIPGIVLQVNAGFDTYQWYNENSPIPIAGATSNTFSPTTPGNYYVKVSSGSCPEVTTTSIRILNCPTQTTITKGICSSIDFTPKLGSSTQNVVLSTVNISTAPTKGTAVINPTTGVITYTPNAGAVGADSFVYKFCGDGAFEDCEVVTVNITIGQLTIKNATLTTCKVGSGGIFDLSNADVTASTPVTKNYYKTLAAAQTLDATQEILNFTAYNSAGGDVYIVVKTPEGCSQIATITLGFFPEIVLDANLYNAINCDDDLDGIINIDFSKITPVILQNSTYFQVRYYLTQAEANAGTTPGLSNIWSYSTDTNVYVRVDSPDGCPFKTAQINFKIGAKVNIMTPVTQPVCSENSSKNIILSDYANFFTADTSVGIKFFSSLAAANANIPGTDIPPNYTISADVTIYLRFAAVGFCDNVGFLNLTFLQPSRSTVLPSTVTICEGSTTTLDAGPGFSSYLWSRAGETTSSIQNAGVRIYTVTLTSTNGCSLVQTVEVKEAPKAILNTSDYTAENCDTNFDGNIYVKFSDITPVILPISTGFTVKYFADQISANTTGATPLADNFSYQTNTTVYVRVESQYCPPIVQPLLLKVGTLLPLTKTKTSVSECDDDLDNIKSVDLSKYLSQFTTDPTITVSYYGNLNNAQNSQNAIANPVSVNKTGTYYLRLSENGFCPVIATLTVNIDVARVSAVLQDKTVCPGTTTTLDAGAGFTSYTWSRAGEKTSSIDNVAAGDYYVDLETGNGCIYRQKVSVKEVDLPKITAIDIKGSTVTITVAGGNAPYYYSLNGSAPQTSNVFYDVKSGKNTISVTSADQCAPVTKEFALIIITNVITPNGDSVNDTFNYSDLKTKDNPKFQIYDRYGKMVFNGSANNNYTWDGTLSNRKLETSSYWYILEWQEFGTSTTRTFSGWVLLKNSDF
ncbi:T9SS type B sorting domain-containing protein [Halpernia frigidisoli]|uniref:Gliding motility-associated C-terminal domain-containing protein n=1 Tax=Halpernia frigidisoli TaxID=1125876 RepID=A0A1I3HXM8_9FLAO|nr:T9SS type B sorting domain-containing protein [Halpernia frigidisoli]SFI40363.1 gliding motility-associated C-terminal domain-containing protein [Halpernia frigidisoli]